MFPQEHKSDKSFFYDEWKGFLKENSVSINFINDSTSLWKTDSSGLYPDGLFLKYDMNFSVLPIKVKFFNLDNTDIPIFTISASVEVIDQNNFKFIGEEVIYSNGKIEKSKNDEGNIFFTRVKKQIK